MLLKSEKQAIMKEYARFEGDTGSPEVQVAVLTYKNQPADGAPGALSVTFNRESLM